MKKVLLLFMFICIVFSSCSNAELNSLIKDLDKKDIEKIIVCNKPYIRHGYECCLDQNSNNICDKDEIEIKEIEKKVQTNVEQQSNTGTAITIERLETDGLYLKNSGATNISITGVEVKGNTIGCSVPFKIAPGVTNIDNVSSCDVSSANLNKEEVVDVVIQTKDGVFQETEIVR